MDAGAHPPEPRLARRRSQRTRTRPRSVRSPSNANSCPTPSASSASAAGRTSSRRSARLVALAGRLQEADRGRELGLGLGLEHALEPQVVEGGRQLLRVRRRVDDPERGRGGVLGRARACTDRARSPRTAARRRAARAARARLSPPPRRAARRAPRRRSAGRARPCAAAGARGWRSRTGDPGAVGVDGVDRLAPGLDRHPEARRAVPRDLHDLHPPLVGLVEDRAVEVEAAAAPRRPRARGSTSPRRARGRRCTGRRSSNSVEPSNAGTSTSACAQRKLVVVDAHRSRLAEQLDQPLAGLAVVAALRGLDRDHGGERDREDPPAARVGGPDLKRQRRRRGALDRVARDSTSNSGSGAPANGERSSSSASRSRALTPAPSRAARRRSDSIARSTPRAARDPVPARP